MVDTNEVRSHRTTRILIYNITAFLAVMLFSCGNPTSVIQQLASDDTLSGIVAYDIVYYRSDSGIVQMELKAPVMVRQGNDTSFLEFPQGFHASIFNNSHRVVSEISADYGIHRSSEKLVLAEGNVVVENHQQGQKLMSDKLYWYQDTKMIYTRSKVRIIMPDKDVMGDSLVSTEGFEEYTIYNGQGTFEVEEDQ
ncbi:MAG: LPS export ABC transporter periplasmic protein LptC [Bacteroidales bacterium]|nr:LPS export ABC transporter periplasmic protein LptC [Bacteroidales bacterium]